MIFVNSDKAISELNKILAKLILEMSFFKPSRRKAFEHQVYIFGLFCDE